MDGEDIVKWGKFLAHDGDYKMYRSYTYRGVEYNVYDSVYTFSAGSKETDIGKIMMITETKKVREVKISWFFRPRDICNFLREYKPCWNELFLACGAGKGLSSFVPLEAIIGKCNVICTSKDRRVPLQSKSDIEKADYFFSHAFDVGTRKLLRNLPDTIDCIKVERLLNPLIDEPKPKANVERPRVVIPGSRAEDAERRYSSDQLRTANVKLNEKESDVKEEAFRMLEQPVPENRALKRRKISEADSVYNLKLKSRADDDEVDDEANGTFSEKPQRPAPEQKWLCKLPWEQNIMVAHEQRRLVTINNLDPSYTSSDVQDVISSAFNLKVDAKIIPRRSFSNTLHGQALVIFNSMDEANFVISELNKKCLVDGEGRPIVAVKTKLVDLPKRNHFPGHIALELHEIKKRTSKAKTVSTSHCAQQNTCESKMAMEWILFHQRADFWCKTLHEEQEKEIDACLNKLKSRQPSEYTKVCGKNSKPVVEVQIKKESALCWKDRNHGQSIQPNKNSKPAVKLRIKKRKCTLFKGQ